MADFTRSRKKYFSNQWCCIFQAVNDLLSKLPDDREEGEFLLTVTNNNNGVSVDKTFSSLAALRDPLTAADAVKDLINIVRGYESDEETNVCGW